jgi:hypothetical protein
MGFSTIPSFSCNRLESWIKLKREPNESDEHEWFYLVRSDPSALGIGSSRTHAPIAATGKIVWLTREGAWGQKFRRDGTDIGEGKACQGL